MVSQKQLTILNQGVEVWNEWRNKNLNLEIDLSGTDLSGAYLRSADLRSADLYASDLRSADLRSANLYAAYLRNADLSGAYLRNADLYDAYLYAADLSGAYLRSANLSGAHLRSADLSNANLLRMIAFGTNFKGATFTGACIQDWNINNQTNFENVTCDYIYLKTDKKERRPANGNFKPGEFAKLVKKSIETIDLIFSEGIDWKAFLSSFGDLRVKYGEENVSIQAMELGADGAFVIRLNVPPDAKGAEIENYAKQSYEGRLQVLETDNLCLLQHNASLENIVNTLASTPIIFEAKVLAQNQSKNVEVKMNFQALPAGAAQIVSGDMNVGTSEQKQTLAEAAFEIQELLKKLEESYPTNTTTEQMIVATEAIKRIESDPTLKQRVINAVREGSLAAFEKALDNPVSAFITSAIKSWLEAEAK